MMMEVALLQQGDGYSSCIDGWADLVIFSAVFTTLCSAFSSAARQQLYQTERLLVRMFSIAPPVEGGEGRRGEVNILIHI